jgi:DNA-binding GntR family transcriptional regulator
MNCGKSHLVPLPPIGDGSSTSRLADELALAIHLGRTAPGTPLREVEIAEANNVSRTIVRAALQRLEAQGLAEITLNKGARVREPDAVAAEDMIELHVQLAALAARSAALRASPEQVEMMRKFAALMEHLAEDGGEADAFQHLRIGFARALFAAAGPVLAERLRTAAPATPYHARAMDDLRTREGQAEAARDARDVLRAVEARAPDTAAAAAERMLRQHAERTIVGRLRQTA